VKSYLLTADAENDIDNIKYHLLEQGGPRLARRVMDKIEDALAFLGRRPGAGHNRNDLTAKPVKFWQVFSYSIIYDPAPRPIHVVRILHTSRDVKTLLHGRRRPGS